MSRLSLSPPRGRLLYGRALRPHPRQTRRIYPSARPSHSDGPRRKHAARSFRFSMTGTLYHNGKAPVNRQVEKNRKRLRVRRTRATASGLKPQGYPKDRSRPPRRFARKNLSGRHPLCIPQANDSRRLPPPGASRGTPHSGNRNPGGTRTQPSPSKDPNKSYNEMNGTNRVPEPASPPHTRHGGDRPPQPRLPLRHRSVTLAASSTQAGRRPLRDPAHRSQSTFFNMGRPFAPANPSPPFFHGVHFNQKGGACQGGKSKKSSKRLKSPGDLGRNIPSCSASGSKDGIG